MKQIHENCITTENSLEVWKKEYRGFAIKEFVSIIKFYDIDIDYCPDMDTYHLGIPGKWELQVTHLYRAVRVKNGKEITRGCSIEEVQHGIDNCIGMVRDPIPF